LVVRKAPRWFSNAAFYLLLLFVTLGAARMTCFAVAVEDEWVLLVLVVLGAWESGALILLIIGWLISRRLSAEKGIA
jgi:hypothetical protein